MNHAIDIAGGAIVGLGLVIYYYTLKQRRIDRQTTRFLDGIKEGIADARAGRTRPADEVFAELGLIDDGAE